MNGIESILQRLCADAQAETDAILEKARQEAAAVTARYQAQADQEAAALAARNAQTAAEREKRLVSAAQMEARKTLLSGRQALMEEAYAQALCKLQDLPQGVYAELLTALLVQAAPEGRGAVCFSPRDRAQVGQAVVDAANERLCGSLTLSEETADIPGGLLLRCGRVEVNCALDTLLRQQKAETVGEAAHRLFD